SVQCAGSFPYLHSFPTRRSSDLWLCCSLAPRARGSCSLVNNVPTVGRPRAVYISPRGFVPQDDPSRRRRQDGVRREAVRRRDGRSEEHTSELQSLRHLVCRLLLE